MVEERDNFLSRWSRLKTAAASEPAAPAAATPSPAAATAAPPAESPPLPSPETLDFESDFSAFMDRKVKDDLRRAALKRLFADPRFNVMDGLDTYIDDYTRGETIPEEMMAKLEHARHTLFGGASKQAAGVQPAEEPAEPEETAPTEVGTAQGERKGDDAAG